MKKRLYDKLARSPVIAAVKDADALEAALECPSEIIFLLCGNIFNLQEIVERAHRCGKDIFIHVDLIEGFSRDAVSLRYIAEHICPTGIISTKSSQIKMAKELGLTAIQRLFIIDSLSMRTAAKTTGLLAPEALEIMPGIMPKILHELSRQLETPLIAGGLITKKEDVINALNAGALGVSTTNSSVWTL
ncbi:MAG: glycerol-3-phosphate responsive antiterminator [Candidatus Fimivicinus sp.]|nr:glycerol-3-phosphate responsive antiterminator [Oscillospiraceae bacterium]MDY5590283.1 glycerol-3-phosphate responsive antiterminator [Candidatus Fimivicinus sp.]